MEIIIIITFLVVSIFAVIIDKTGIAEEIVFVLLGILLIIIAGLRTPGYDYYSYVDIFNGVYSKSIEPGIVIISHVLKCLFDDPVSLFLLFSCIGVSLKLKAINQLTTFIFSSLAIYISYFFLYHEMIQIRAGIASGILLLSIKPLYERNFIRVLLLTFIGSLFHISALVIVPLLFLSVNRLNKSLYTGLILLSYTFSLLSINISNIISIIPIERVQLLFQGYVYTTQQGLHTENLNIFNLLQILRVILVLLLIHSVDKIYQENVYAKLMVKIYAISVSIYVLFSDLPVLAIRISQLLGIVEIILIPFAIYLFNDKSKKISQVIPVSIGFGILCLMLFYRNLI